MTTPVSIETSSEGEALACELARIADDLRAENVIILDLRGLCAVADFFVIATGTSDRQMRAVADQMEQFGKSVSQRPFGISGIDSATWVLIDFVDVVVHVFETSRRKYYDLELLWGDAPVIEWHRSASA
jgi:ribosome-associated protein